MSETCMCLVDNHGYRVSSWQSPDENGTVRFIVTRPAIVSAMVLHTGEEIRLQAQAFGEGGHTYTIEVR